MSHFSSSFSFIFQFTSIYFSVLVLCVFSYPFIFHSRGYALIVTPVIAVFEVSIKLAASGRTGNISISPVYTKMKSAKFCWMKNRIFRHAGMLSWLDLCCVYDFLVVLLH